MASGLHLDPETALELVKKGSTLLLLDVPQFTLFGIDTQVFSVGPNFKGIKMIPPGPHFIYYRSSNKERKEFSPTTGFFITTHVSEILVRKWDPKEERLVDVPEDEEYRYSEAVKHFEFDHQLGPYALDHYEEWRKLSDFITKSTIERIEPIGREISIVYESGLFDEAPSTSMEKSLVSQLNDSKFSTYIAEKSQKHGCFYTAIPHVVKYKDMSAEDLTALNLDKTKLLENTLIKDYGGAEDLLLGELQFAFVAFMMGQSLEAFLQWKSLVSLLLSCTEAPLHSRTQLFSKFLRVIYFQLKQGLHNTSGDGNSLFLDDAMFSKDTFLYQLCKDFFSLVLESRVVDGDLISWDPRTSRKVGTSSRLGNLYHLDYLHVSSTAVHVVFASTSTPSDVDLWHIRLGHLSSQRLQLLTQSGILGCVSMISCCLCTGCKLAKCKETEETP